MSCQVAGCDAPARASRGMCWPHYNRWKANRPQNGAAPETTVDLWRRAAADGIRPYIVGLLDTVLGPPPPPGWQPSPQTVAMMRRRLGLEETVVDVDRCYCGELVNAAGVHTATSDVRCFPDEPAVPDRAEVPPSAA